MQENVTRKISLYTPNKIYSGYMDIKAENIRTIDLLNSSNLYWKDPGEKSFADSIMLNQASITIEGNKVIGTFPSLQLRLSDIIFFTDLLEQSGDDTEKARASTLSQKSQDTASMVRILTRMRGDSFYLITGIFLGLFKSKSQQRYLPVTQPQVNEIIRTGDQWSNKKVAIHNNFIGLAVNQIEACTFGKAEDLPGQ
ncbi:MAG: hypothetical protein ACN4GW_04360 [Desulforhopalus sp.]